MALAPFNTPGLLGEFTETKYNHYFEWSLNDDSMAFCEDFPHKIWVADTIGSRYRYGLVKKTVAYICTDEDEFGLPVVEKWQIKKHVLYKIM